MAKKLQAKTIYNTLGQIFLKIGEMFKPPERLTVSEAAEKYVYLNTPGAYVGPWQNSTVPYMVEPTDTFVSRSYNGMVFVGPAQTGKALAIDTPIATPDGWTTMGDLQVGDTIFSETGEPCMVVFATEVMHDHRCYDVVFEDGTRITADAEHRWCVRDDKKEGAYIVTTTEAMAPNVRYGKRLHRNRYAIDVAGALKTDDRDLPIDPYLLGVWLGDGGAYGNRLYLNTADSLEIVNRLRKNPEYTFEVQHNQKSENCVTVVIQPAIKFNKLLSDLHLLRTPEDKTAIKEIPAEYFRGSFEQRLALMQGLMDTDGTCSKTTGACSFTTIYEKFANDMRELVASLGLKSKVSSYHPTYHYLGEKRTAQLTHDVVFFAYDDLPVFHLFRKYDLQPSLTNGKKRRPSYTKSRRIVEIIPVKSVPVRCIQVDSPSHLFLAGKMLIPTHNTQALILNTIVYSAMIEPMDMMLVCPTMLDGRDFSIRRIDRMNHYCPEMKKILVAGQGDNTFDKTYANGMLFTIAWPTRSQLAGKPIGRIVLTDRDRMDDDVEGDGEPFDLASKRTTTFGSYAMTLAESSPSRPIENLKWIAQSPHEAPPCKGILGLYNRGDRRRYYWKCPHCAEWFEGNFKHLRGWDEPKKEGKTNLEAAEKVWMACPRNGCVIVPDEREQMNLNGKWVKDGQAIDKDDNVIGPEPRTLIASFWLNGVAAAFTNWKKLVAMYLDAEDEYTRTGSEEALTKFYNNDLGEPYIPRSMFDTRTPESLKSRAEKLGERVVPEGTRFLIACVDVQKNMWRVDVFGIQPGQPFDIVVIDRFDVRKSQRTDDDGEKLWVKPHAYLEDWDELIPHVIEKEYPLDDGSGRKMGIKFTVCDSGGKEGVTTRAYDFYRSLRERNLHRRFILLKGDKLNSGPRTRISYPDASRKDNKSAARGDIPLLLLNVNTIKDDVNGRLDRVTPGKGMIRFPDWLPDSFYAELCAEVRTEKGWENMTNSRNEDWDLLVYCIGVCVSELLRVEALDWSKPPGWAAEWDANDLVSAAEELPRFKQQVNSGYDFARFAKALA